VLDETVIDHTKKHEVLGGDSTRYTTLKPGYFVMQSTCWRPVPFDREFDDHEDFDDDKMALWLLYYWGNRGPGAHWNTDPSFTDTSESDDESTRLAHPRLGKALQNIKSHGAGNVSHFALGETSDSYFVRVSDNDRHWHYRHGGLPYACNEAIQASMSSSKGGWQHGRLRGVTLGQAGGWVVFHDNHHQVKWGGRHLPKKLKKALQEGKMQKNIINVSYSLPTATTKIAVSALGTNWFL